MREMPPADPFPTDALGHVLRNAATGIHDRTRAPIAICGQSVLAVATLATQAYADVALPTGQTRPLSNYFATVGVSGERKSAVDYEAMGPVRKREEALREAYDAEMFNYSNAFEAWDRARKHAVEKCKGAQGAIKLELDKLGPAPSKPLRPLLHCSEPTIEGLMKTFAEGWPSLGIFTDEGGMFVGGHGMKDDAKLRTATTLSKLWDGSAIDRVRSGEGALILPGRRLTTHLMMQPNVAAMFLADGLLAEQGLLSRVLATAPESAIGTRMWREASPESEHAIQVYGTGLLDILYHALPLVEGRSNELAPRTMVLSPSARNRWIAYHDHIEVDLSGGLQAVRGLANKIPEIAARLAGVLALVEDIGAGEITDELLERSVALTDHYLAEALRLFQGSQVSAELLRAQELLRWLTANVGASALRRAPSHLSVRPKRPAGQIHSQAPCRNPRRASTACSHRGRGGHRRHPVSGSVAGCGGRPMSGYRKFSEAPTVATVATVADVPLRLGRPKSHPTLLQLLHLLQSAVSVIL